MKTVTASLLLVAFLVAMAIAAQDKKDDAPPKKPRGKFTVSKKTTYITGPLDKDGYPDYAAALNERLRHGVTPENNAAVLLWKAMGPRPMRTTMPAKFFELMGMQSPPEKGEYFVEFHRFLKDRFQIDVVEKAAEISAQETRATQRLWRADELPNVAAFLKVNEKPLALVVEASKRARYFSPLLSREGETAGIDLLAILDVDAQQCRYSAYALTARATLYAGQGRDNEAWENLLTCHRLARLV